MSGGVSSAGLRRVGLAPARCNPQVLTADRALLEAQLAHANAHIDGVERQLSAMRRQLAGLVDDDAAGSPDAYAERGAVVVWAGGRSGACSANGSEVRAAPILQ